MPNRFSALAFAAVMTIGSACAQEAAPATPPAAPPTTTPAPPAAPSSTSSSAPSDDKSPQQAVADDDIGSPGKPGAKISLVRGVVKRMDPIHDQFVLHAFGGRDIRIAFDPRTKLLPEKKGAQLSSLPLGTVVAVDTVIDNGKLFARSVRTSPANAAELNGQVVRYDAAKSRLILRDPLSTEGTSIPVTSATTITNQGQPATPQDLSPGMLVRIWFSPAYNAASKVEIFAQRGNSFTFAGRVISVDLRSHVLSLSNDTDQSVRELSIDSLNDSTLHLLKEGANVSLQAEFDGDRYNVRSVDLLSPRP
jgi:hypothetical protein